MQGHGGTAMSDLIRRRLDRTCIRMPQFSLFSVYAERCVQCFIAVVAMVHVLQITIGKLAVDEQQAGVSRGLGVIEVAADVELG